jgi:predicted acylesterase/phospholipase RssA
LTARAHDERSLAHAEEALVQYALNRPGELSVADETTLRQAFALARLSPEAEPAARRTLAEYSRVVLAVADGLFGDAAGPLPSLRPELLRAAAGRLWNLTLAARDQVGSAWEPELRQRRLVLALGGGGGVGYVYLGCFALLEQWGLTPALIAGTSFGAVLGLFRAQRPAFHAEDTAKTLAGLSYKRLFRFLRVRSQYALPGPVQLYLRRALLPALHALARREGKTGRDDSSDDLGPVRLDELAIPLVVTVAGVRRGMLPRPPKEYERLLDPRSFFPPTPHRLQSRVLDLFSVLGEFVRQPNRLDTLALGADPGTADFDALDAIGFSCSLPGFIHYDVLREEPVAHRHIQQLLDGRELGWLADGGLVENCPARVAQLAYRASSSGVPRNGFVLALDAFSPKLSTAPWVPLQRLAQETVRRVLPWADRYVAFRRTLSPLTILPNSEQIARAEMFGRAQLAPSMPFLAKMLTPLPALETCRPAA